MSIVLKRPMFRKGGSVAEGTGITSGLTNRKRFADGSDNPMGDYVNTDDNDLYTAAQKADFLGSDEDRERAKNILRDIISKNIENEKSYTPTYSTSSDNKDVANDWMDYLSTSGSYLTPTVQPKVKQKTDIGDDYSQLGPGYETTAEDVKKAMDQINKDKAQQITQKPAVSKPIIGADGKPIISPDKKTTSATVTDESVGFADLYPVYNAQGQNITPSIINAAQILRSQMTPSDSDSIRSFLRKFGSTAKGPLELQTIGSALGETAEKVDVAKQKADLELNKYLGTIMGRTIGTLGKASAQTSIGKLSGNPKIAFEKAVISTGINPKTIEEAIADPIFIAEWKKQQAALGEVTPQQKLERVDEKSTIKGYARDYNMAEDKAKLLYNMIKESENKGVSEKDRDLDLPYLRHAKDLQPPAANGVRYPARSLNNFEGPNAKYKPGKVYADLQTGQWYRFVRDPDGRNSRFEPLK